MEAKLLAAYDSLPKEAVVEEVWADTELQLAEVTWDTYKEIERLSPFGIDNGKPLFLFRDIEIDKVKTFGTGGAHIELSFTDGGRSIPAIGFFACPPTFDTDDEFDPHTGHHFSDVALAPGRRIDLLASFDKSNFRNWPELRLRIVDIRSVV